MARFGFDPLSVEDGREGGEVLDVEAAPRRDVIAVEWVRPSLRNTPETRRSWKEGVLHAVGVGGRVPQLFANIEAVARAFGISSPSRALRALRQIHIDYQDVTRIREPVMNETL